MLELNLFISSLQKSIRKKIIIKIKLNFIEMHMMCC